MTQNVQNQLPDKPVCEFDRLAEAGLEGYDYARNAKLPRIPKRWLSSPELRSVWITGYLTELRNRLEAK